MRYEFIKIVDTQEGQIAYMLDHERGVVVIAPVEYLGDAPKEETRPARRVVEYVEEERPPVRTVRRAPVEEVVVEETVAVDRTPRMEHHGRAAGEGVDPGGLKDIGHSKPSKANSIIPPHLRGLMRKDADFEKRETIG